MDICGYNHFFKAQTLHEKCLHTEFFSSPYFSIFGLNSENYGPEKICIWTLFFFFLSPDDTLSLYVLQSCHWAFFQLMKPV